MLWAAPAKRLVALVIPRHRNKGPSGRSLKDRRGRAADVNLGWRRRVWWRKDAGTGQQAARGADYRRDGAGRGVSIRISAWPRLHRAWRQAALVLLQHRPRRSSLPGPPCRQRAVPDALWRHDGFDQSDPPGTADQAYRDLQPRRPEPCRRQLREPGIYRQCRRRRRAAPPGGHPHPRTGEGDPLLPGLDLRALWSGAGDPAEGDHAVLSALALRRRKALWLLDHGELPRGLWDVCQQRHPVQP